MAIVVTDLIVPEGTVTIYPMSDSLDVPAALWMGGDWPNEYEPSLINHGEMHLSNSGHYYGVLIYFSSHLFWDDATFENYGLISAVDQFRANAISASAWGPDFFNAGTVFTKASREAIGFLTWDFTTQITNSATGSIVAESQEIAIAIRMANAHGVITGGGEETFGLGSIVNDGEIIARSTGNGQTGQWEQAIAIHLGNGGPGSSISITNSGLIEATDTDPSAQRSIGIFINGDDGGSIVNSGTIRGDYAIFEETNGQPYTFDITIENSGLIEGIVRLNEGRDSLVNSGTISGAVQLGENADFLLNRGTITGIVELGSGNDVYVGTGGTQSGGIFGQDGSDLLIGTAGADQLDGGTGDDILVGGGGDTLTGGLGRDDFLFTATATSAVTISDFVSGTDVIDLSWLHPTSVTINGSTVTVGTASGSFAITVSAPIVASDIITTRPSILAGTATGDQLTAGPAASTLQGLGGADLLMGSVFNDVLDGGAGEDTMWGGLGDDLFIVDVGFDGTTAGDTVIELANGGTDTIQSSYNYILPDNVENLTLVGDAGFGGGNALDNIIIGSDATNRLYGRDGNDQLFGGAAQDFLIGGAGADILTGGAGADTFRGTIEELDGDTITDLSSGDMIHFMGASIDSFSFSVTGNVLSFTGGSITLQQGFSGNLTISSDAFGVLLTIPIVPGHRDVVDDFNGDGRSDILWRHSDGTVGNWLTNVGGTFTSNGASVAGASGYWQVAGTGDFNGDGRDDILWRGAGGEVGDWLANANGIHSYNAAAGIVVVPENWQIAGIGDFNGDSRDDILWRSSTGTVGTWSATDTGGFSANNSSVFNVSSDWHIAAVGDFNGDGQSDILWRHDSGTIANWLANDSGGFSPNFDSLVSISNDWHIIGTGDFDGNGLDDILWRHDSGTVANWLTNVDVATFSPNFASLVTISNDWSIVAIGDFIGDGNDDILWRHDSGTIANWLANADGSFSPNNPSLTPISNDWNVQSPDIQLI